MSSVAEHMHTMLRVHIMELSSLPKLLQHVQVLHM